MNLIRLLPVEDSVFRNDDTLNEKEEHPEHRNYSGNSSAILDYLSILLQSGITAAKVNLKVSCLCEIIRNICIQNELVKNPFMVVQKTGCYIIFACLILQSSNSGIAQAHYILCIIFLFKYEYTPWHSLSFRIPLVLTYFTAFIGCQSLTLDAAILNLCTSVLSHMQLYIGLLRARHSRNIFMLFTD